MKIKLLAFAAIASMAAATAAHAGNTTLTKGDQRMKLWCDNGGCYTQEIIAPFKFGQRTRIGPGGSANFRKHKSSYQSKGWN